MLELTIFDRCSNLDLSNYLDSQYSFMVETHGTSAQQHLSAKSFLIRNAMASKSSFRKAFRGIFSSKPFPSSISCMLLTCTFLWLFFCSSFLLPLCLLSVLTEREFSFSIVLRLGDFCFVILISFKTPLRVHNWKVF